MSFLVGDTLRDVAGIVVTVPDGTWTLGDTLLFQLEARGLVQVLIEVHDQDVVMISDDADAQIKGDYDDLIERHLESIELLDVELPDKVIAIDEFQSEGKVIGVEIQLTKGAFSVLLYPEDVEILPAGALWEFMREYGMEQLERVNVLRVASGRPIQPSGESS